MSDQSEKRRRFVMTVANRILDLPDDAPIEDLKASLEAFGIDPDAAVETTKRFIRDYPKQLLSEAKVRHEKELEAFNQFQEQISGLTVQDLKSRIAAIMPHLPKHVEPQFRAHYRDLSNQQSEDIRSELLDLLWQLEKLTKKEDK